MRLHVLFALTVCSFIAGAGSLPADDAKDDAIKKERQKYIGTWRVTSLIVDGKEISEEDAKKISVINEADGKWTIQVEGKPLARGISDIDPTTKPKTIDFTPSDGANAGQTCLGIYELGKNTRKLCYAPPNKHRPSEFASNPGTGYVVVTFKREE